MRPTPHHSEFGEVVSRAFIDSDVSRNGHCQPLFEGFSNSKEDCDPANVNLRIYFLQKAKRSLLESSLGLPVVSLPTGTRGSLTNAVTSAVGKSEVGLRRRIGLLGMGPGDSCRPHLMVQHSSPHCRGFSCVSPTRSSVLVRRVRSRLGSKPVGLLCLRSLVL